MCSFVVIKHSQFNHFILQLALLAAVAMSFGAPDWANVKLPEDRSTLACRKMYARLTKGAAGAQENWDVKPKTPENEKTRITPGPKPKKRKRGSDEVVRQDHTDDEEDFFVAKKPRVGLEIKIDDDDDDTDSKVSPLREGDFDIVKEEIEVD